MGLFKKKRRDSSSSFSDEADKAEVDAAAKVPLITLFRYATSTDILLMVVGCFCACVTGSALPVMSIQQGLVTQAFTDEQACVHGHNHSGCHDDSFHDTVMHAIWIYAATAIIVFTTANIQVTCWLIACENMSNRIRRAFVKAILRQDIPWFDKNNSGTLATKLFDNLERVKEGTGDKIGMMCQFLAQFISGFIVAFCHSWELTLVMVSMTPFQALCGFAMSKSMTVFTIAETRKYAKAGRVVEEAVSSVRTVVALNGIRKEIDRYKVALVEARRAGILKNTFMGAAFGMLGLTQFTSFAIAFYVGVGWVADGKLDQAHMLTTFFSVMMGSLALGQAGPQFAVLGAAQGAAAHIFEVLDRTPEIDSSSPLGIREPPLRGNIEVRGVKFRYPARPDVQILKELTLSVKAGQTVALVGSSGCGKSTIIQLLLRYYDVQTGSITIDGIPVHELNIEFLRNQIAVVSQEPILFNCSIEENIRYGREDITREEMVEACAMANALTFINGLPNGFQTTVGDRGTQLSGGQKQRIAIARALVRNPKILLLDEATSALDAESEGVVQRALEKASKGRTTIVIAHRLSTIRNADKIIAMRGGVVVEQGTHDELLRHKGLYHDLVMAQSFTDAVDDVKATDEDGDEGYEPIENETTRLTRASTRASKTSIGYSMDAQRRLFNAAVAPMADAAVEESPDKEKKDDITRLKKEMDAEGVGKTSIFYILGRAREHWLYLFGGLGVSFIGGLVFPAYSVVFMQVIQVFSDPATMLKNGHFWALMFLVLAVCQGAILFSETVLMGFGSENLAMDLRAQLFTNVLSHDMGYFDSPLHACGKICTRLAMDVPNLRSSLDFRFCAVTTTIISVCAGTTLAFIYGWQMALLTVAVLPILGFGHAVRTRVMSGKHRKGAQDFEDSGKVAMEAIEHVRTVQALTREETFYNKFCHYLDGPHKDALFESFLQGLAYGFASCCLFILIACAYRLGLYLALNDYMQPLKVLRVMYAMSISASTLGFATSYIPEYMKARLAGGIIFKMIDERTGIDNLTESGKRPTLTGQITFKDVKFHYPERPTIPILKGLNFTVVPGQTLALVGPSGCGKSTVIQLLERFYDPAGGQVLLDGYDMRDLNPWHVRSQIAIVSQEPILFDCSISENIVYGMPVPASQSEIEEAAKKANIHNFITGLPAGYNTQVGSKGTQLSGGQKQRIAIARALVRKPKILLLDEATSALDTESEKVVQDALDRAREGRTCIVIAHRLSTIVNSDIILVVKAGVVTEKGNHQELLNQRGFYYELTQKQTLKTTPD